MMRLIMEERDENGAFGKVFSCGYQKGVLEH